MKKLILSITVIMVSLVYASAEGANWILVSSDASGCALFYDRDSITYRFKGDEMRKVLIKRDPTNSSDCRKERIKVLQKNHVPTNDYRYSQQLIEVDCGLKRIRILSTSDYDSHKTAFNSNEHHYSEWTRIAPMSEMDKLHQKVCTEIHINSR